MSNTNHTKVRTLVGTAILAALVIILQFLSGMIKIGPFSITLVLIPIVVGAVIYGRVTGAVLGLIFSTMVVINVISGTDAGGFIMFNAKPIATVGLCLLKGTAAGYLAGVVANIFKDKNLYLGVILSAITAPIVNTGIFLIGMVTLFSDILAQWAGQSSVVVYILTGLVGVNFLIELIINVVLSPIVIRIVRAGRKMGA